MICVKCRKQEVLLNREPTSYPAVHTDRHTAIQAHYDILRRVRTKACVLLRLYFCVGCSFCTEAEAV